MTGQLTLPILQSILDALRYGQSVGLRRDQVHRLFGNDDLTDTKVDRFAASHRCDVTATDGVVIFAKILPR